MFRHVYTHHSSAHPEPLTPPSLRDLCLPDAPPAFPLQECRWRCNHKQGPPACQKSLKLRVSRRLMRKSREPRTGLASKRTGTHGEHRRHVRAQADYGSIADIATPSWHCLSRIMPTAPSRRRAGINRRGSWRYVVNVSASHTWGSGISPLGRFWHALRPSEPATTQPELGACERRSTSYDACSRQLNRTVKIAPGARANPFTQQTFLILVERKKKTRRA